MSAQSAILLLGAFALLVAFLGGASRADQIHHALLRPAAALFLIPALYLIDRKSWHEMPVVLSLLGGLIVWMGLQLVPLPPTLWQALPDRAAIAELDRLTDFGDLWRPLAMAPTRGTNALFGLIVPIAALLLALSVRSTSQLILHVILAISLINAALGFLQLAAGPNSPFYLYAYAPSGASFGLFANRNHGAVFSVLALLVVARLMGEGAFSNKRSPAWTKIAYPVAFTMLLLSVLVTGSRTAFLALFVALAASSVQAFILAGAQPSDGKHRRGRKGQHLRWYALLLAAFALGLIALFIGLERAPALDRLMSQDPIADLRWQALPVLKEMAATHWLWGSGFGSFDVLYQAYEPTELLMVAYFNHAHNDWLQIVIEGGLPACLLLAGLIVWMLLAIGRLRHNSHRQAGNVQMIFWITAVLVVVGASLVDYPLRTPIFQAVGVWLLVSLARDQNEAGQAA